MEAIAGHIQDIALEDCNGDVTSTDYIAGDTEAEVLSKEAECLLERVSGQST